MKDESWRLLYAASMRKDLRRLDHPIRKRVISSLEKLAERGPEQTALMMRLSGSTNWRLRVGDWRVIVEMDDANHTIKVKRVLPRGRAYDR